jgi:hypothetical protein
LAARPLFFCDTRSRGNHKEVRVLGQMTKKKATNTDAAAPAAKKSGKKKASKNKDAAQVREELAGMVKSGAKEITEAVMDQAMQGELAPAKYLLEMAGVFPPPNDGEQATEEEDCLAKTLLDRLNILRKPSQSEEDADEPAAGAEKVKKNDEPGTPIT